MKSLQLAGSAFLVKDRAFFGVSRFVCLRRSVYDSREPLLVAVAAVVESSVARMLASRK